MSQQYAPPPGPPPDDISSSADPAPYMPSTGAFAPNSSAAAIYAPGVPAAAFDQPPPQEPLPSYTDTVRPPSENKLLPAFTIIQVICIIIAIILLIAHITNAGILDQGHRAAMYVAAGLFACCFVLHICALVFVLRLRGHIITPLCVSLSMVLAIVAQVISIAVLYEGKDSTVISCLERNSIPEDQWHDKYMAGNRGYSTPESYWDACSSSWNAYAVWNIVWFVAILLVTPFFITIAFMCNAHNRAAATAARAMYQPTDDWENESYAMSAVPPYDLESDPLSEHERKLIDAKIEYPEPGASDSQRT